MKRWSRIAGLALVLTFLIVGTVVAQGTEEPPAGQVQIAFVLAPLLAAATAIERIIEMVFNWIESIVLNLGDFLGLGGRYLRWSQQQVEYYRNELLNLKAGGGTHPQTVQQVEDALLNAEERLVAFLKSPYYTRRKSVIALIMGLVLGVAAAVVARLQMFQLLGIDLARGIANPGVVNWLSWADMVITGTIIGTGSAPVHSLIGILQQTRDAIDKAGELWSGRAFAEVQEELRHLRQEQATALNKAPVETAVSAAQIVREYRRVVR